MDLQLYWKAALSQEADIMRDFFHRDAYINWHNTNEHFTVQEFIRANCEYPGEWDGEIERIEQIGDLYITVTHVYSPGGELSFHVTSFIKLKDDKIIAIDEYWGDDGTAPQWRLDKHIGTPIHR
ncbi:nuclear transport factor 2 family protein [Blautia schinkii]|nr:nuclear transport factor 2 family protein [Blautia schinkii]